MLGIGRWRRREEKLPRSWRTTARRSLRQWPLLDAGERQRLESRATDLLRKRWEAAHGFTIDDTMRVTIALNAALLAVGHDERQFRNVTAIVVHPTTMVLREPRPGPSPGVVTDAPLPTVGHTSANGPVFVAWDVVAAELAQPERTANVILHEFAHKIDALNGTMDGTPPLTDAADLQEWVEVCTTELASLRRGEVGLLRPYAATNPAEFFAVATEAFFEQPVLLREVKPRLYGLLSRYYRQDTAARQVRAQDQDRAH